MLRKEPRYRFADENNPAPSPLQDTELHWGPQRRRFDSASAVAVGVLAAFLGVFGYNLFSGGGLSGELTELYLAADEVQDQLADLWRNPLRVIEQAFAHD